jgi:hypothetical protein
MGLSEEMMRNAFECSGSSPGNSSETDFICQNHGSLFLLFPLTAPASNWIEEHLPSDRMTFGDGIVIEPRYVWAILVGLQEDGLTVSR